MNSLACRLFVCAAVIAGPFLPAAGAEEKTGVQTAEYVDVKNEDGISFTLPKDWPLQKMGASIGPVPIEQYLGMKFDKVNERITSLEERLSILEAGEAQTKKKTEKKMLRAVETNEEEIPDGGGL